MGALLYLRLASLRGLLLSRLRRLRQPKYLLGTIVGAAYVYFVFVHRMRPGRGAENAVHAVSGVNAVPPTLLPTVTTLGAFVLLTIVAVSWIVPRRAAGLAFTAPEIAFLFPAPITRRKLINYKLINSQLVLLFTALVLAVLSNRWRFLGGNAATHAFGWWVMLATLNLHFTGAALVTTSFLGHGVTPLRQRLAALAIVVAVIAGMLLWAWRELSAPSAADLRNVSTLAAYLAHTLDSGPLSRLLLPFKWLLGPFLAPHARTFASALAPALAVLLAHYAWVLGMDVPFEDSAVARAERRAARGTLRGDWREARAAVKARRPPFLLAGGGRPEVAFLWKNLLATGAFARPYAALAMACLIVAACSWLNAHPLYRAASASIALGALIAAAYVLLLGPMLIQQDLRADLRNLDILKTYPLRGWQIVLGELLTPLAILTVLLWLAVLAAALSFQPRRMPWLTREVRTGLAVGLAIVAPSLCTVLLLVPNAAAIVFPAWISAARRRGERGLEVLGQRIIFFTGQTLVAAFALGPALLVSIVVFFVARAWLGAFAAELLAALAMLGVLATEGYFAVRWLGERLERFDLATELSP